MLIMDGCLLIARSTGEALDNTVGSELEKVVGDDAVDVQKPVDKVCDPIVQG